MNKSSVFCQLNLLQAFLPWARPSGRSSKSNQLGDFLPPHCLVDLAWKCMKETDGWGKMWLKWIISKPRHVMLKQGQDKWSCHCFFPKHCSPGSKWKGPVLVESICNPKTPSPSLQRGLLPRVCVMRMATLKVCHNDTLFFVYTSLLPVHGGQRLFATLCVKIKQHVVCVNNVVGWLVTYTVYFFPYNLIICFLRL